MEYPALSRKPFLNLKRFLYFLLWIVELLLLAQFLIEVAAFNPAAPFTSFMTSFTLPFLWPFKNIYPPAYHGQMVIDWSILIAMVVYQILFYIVVSALELLWLDN